MQEEILRYLLQQGEYQEHNLIPFLRSTFNEHITGEIRKALVELEQSKKISIRDNAHIWLNGSRKFDKEINEPVTFDNWQILAKIEQPGREYLNSIRHIQSETEKNLAEARLAELQFRELLQIRNTGNYTSTENHVITMNEELIIRKEANEFFRRYLDRSGRATAIDDFKEIKRRLYDFYSVESKAIFLDEIKQRIISDLEDHRIKAHGGLPKPGCGIEEKAEKLLFYIQQELSTLPLVAHQKFETQNPAIRNKVFVSYSHYDKQYLSDIQRHFKPFVNKIDFWDDTKIEAGQKWKDEIKKAIEHTKVAILLVSTDFLGSEFIASDELPPLLQAAEKEGAVILTIIIKPCLFEAFTELNQYQALNSPSKPVSKMSEDEREELYVNLVRQTQRILSQ